MKELTFPHRTASVVAGTYSNGMHKELRRRFKGVLRTEALAPGTHAAIKGEVESILAQG